MGSKNGYYEYVYDFSEMDENDIDSKYKSTLKPGVKAFVFVIKTDFIVKARPGEPSTPDLVIDSETFNAHICPQKYDEKKQHYLVYGMTRYRLLEYWMSRQEIKLFATNALAFATDRSKDPQYAAADAVVPVLVRFNVCTLQQEGETFDAARQRAIRENKLLPLYLWVEPEVEPPPGKQISLNFWFFLKFLPRVRVEDPGQSVPGLMGFCLVCKLKPVLGDQISTLPHCNHAFHAHCLVRELLEDIGCPRCGTASYNERIEASHCSSVMFSTLSSRSKRRDLGDRKMGQGMNDLMLQTKYECNKATRSIQAVTVPQSDHIAITPLDGISLVSSEGEAFRVDREAALKSPVLEALIINSSNSTMTIPLPGISSNVVAKIIEFISDSIVDEAKVDVVEFESKFLKDVGLRMLCNLLKASSFLCIPFLSELTATVIAQKLNHS